MMTKPSSRRGAFKVRARIFAPYYCRIFRFRPIRKRYWATKPQHKDDMVHPGVTGHDVLSFSYCYTDLHYYTYLVHIVF
jgi:hypothetical protein